MTPCLLYWLWPPSISSTPEAPAAAAERLRQLGPLSGDERVMIGAVMTAVTLWVSCARIMYDAVAPHIACLSMWSTCALHLPAGLYGP